MRASIGNGRPEGGTEMTLASSVLLPTRNGPPMMVDVVDKDIAGGYAIRINTNGYPAIFRRVNGKKAQVLVHRLIVQPDGKSPVDHINGDRLDNRRCNLRIATRSGNAQNRSGVRGYTRNGNKWQAQIRVNGKNYYLGLFNDPESAAAAHRAAAERLHGEYAAHLCRGERS